MASSAVMTVLSDGVKTADMVVQVLVDGKSPATLPVATFDRCV